MNGLSVIDSIAISETLPIVSGVESGLHTHLVSVHGVPEKLQVPAGGVLTRDAGNLTFSLTYDANDKLVASELVSVKGPHAGFGTNAWCDVATVALGL